MSAGGIGIRDDFPIYSRTAGPFHYLDNAATGQICRAAADALIGFETTQRANVKRGVYRLADQATTAFDEARQTMAAYIGAGDPQEIIFTSGTTLGLNIAAWTLAGRLQDGDEVLLSTLEHHSNIVPWQLAAESRNAVVRAIPIQPDGRLDLEQLDRIVSDRTRVISVTHTSNVTGAVTDFAPIVEAARSVGAILVVDGAQRAPHGPIDVGALGCDMYALSSHKMFGPTGAGVLWVRRGLIETLPPFLGGGEMIHQVSLEGTSYAPAPHRFEAGTPPIGPVLGMAAAARWLHGLDWAGLVEHELQLCGQIIDGLEALPGIRIFGPRGLQGRLGVVSFEVDGIHAHDVCQLLDGFGVCLRGGHHCAQPLMDAFDTVATVRASLAPYNDQDDVAALLDGLDRTIRKFR